MRLKLKTIIKCSANLWKCKNLANCQILSKYNNFDTEKCDIIAHYILKMFTTCFTASNNLSFDIFDDMQFLLNY